MEHANIMSTSGPLIRDRTALRKTRIFHSVYHGCSDAVILFFAGKLANSAPVSFDLLPSSPFFYSMWILHPSAPHFLGHQSGLGHVLGDARYFRLPGHGTTHRAVYGLGKMLHNVRATLRYATVRYALPLSCVHHIMLHNTMFAINFASRYAAFHVTRRSCNFRACFLGPVTPRHRYQNPEKCLLSSQPWDSLCSASHVLTMRLCPCLERS